MLAHAKLPKTIWVEALMMAINVINISPSTHLEGDTPQRVWTGKDVTCRAKLDPKSRLCIFIGYDDDEFGN